ncbi:MAG: DUF4167 domain-containing protein [Roseitalea porphyridii]|uniref:DUF4167 domain-containing protein n=1 Tax=Roseitalea porphyridii TaxID=1852022 RepID=UPI0032EE7D06
MRQGSNSGRRPRGRTNRKQHGGGQSRTHTFDSNGPDGRVRGNARQVYEKYLTLARDATSAGDRVAAEAYYQYAEHYFRILSDSTDPQSGNRRPEERQPQLRGTDDDSSDEDDEQPADGNGNAVPMPVVASAESRSDTLALETEQPQIQPAAADANGQDGEGEAPPRQRRGRARKPRVSQEDKPSKKEAATDSEDGPAAG